ncbi:MAG: hypothetical protein Q8N38_02690, partial [Bacteroidales bacterium]|nr:hypothetical protein [Bacteroidales bacterium]
MRKILFGVLVLFCSVIIVFSCSRNPVTPETALQAYLHKSDKSFKWEVQDKTKAEGVTLYRILFTS